MVGLPSSRDALGMFHTDSFNLDRFAIEVGPSLSTIKFSQKWVPIRPVYEDFNSFEALKKLWILSAHQSGALRRFLLKIFFYG